MSYRYDDNASKMSIANYIISTLTFIAGVIYIAISYTSNFAFISIGFSLSGFGLYNLANVDNIYAEYNFSNKFVRFLLGTATVIGFLFMLLAVGASFSYNNELGKILSISIFLGSMLKVLVQNIDGIFPATEPPKSEFFNYCSLLFFIAGFFAFFFVMNIFFDFHYVLLLFGNWVLSYLVLTSVSHFIVEKTPKFIIMAILFFLIGLGLNLGISLAVNDIANPQFDIKKANLFNIASSLYFFLSIVLGIVASLLTNARSVRFTVSAVSDEIFFMVIPLIAFGVQFLAFFYFKAFLIVAGATLFVITLIMLLFKAFVAVIKFIGECIVGIATGFWYFITFKWVKDVILFFTPNTEKMFKLPNLVLSIEEAARLAAQEYGGEFNTLNGDTLYFTHCKCSKSQLLNAINKHYVGDATKFIIEYYD